MLTSFTRSALRYLATMAFTAVLCCLAVLALNATVDPLWYYSGNRIKPINFAFNERLSKANLIAEHESDYDCVIFGDSRVTLLPEGDIKGYRCFNFAISAGAINEFVDYAKWLKGRGFQPRLVIVGVSAGDFRARKAPRNVPDFIKEGGNPTSPYIKYLSLDVLGMSWRTLFGKSPIDRVYDREFQSVVAVTSAYDPRKPIRDIHAGPFDNREPMEKYHELRGIFPDAEFVGYTPPISAWAIADYESIHWLESYTRAIHDVSKVFDRFIDASIPSAATLDPANTYDGTHYARGVNAGIAGSLVAGPVSTYLDVKRISSSEMFAAYRLRLNAYSKVIARALDEPSAPTSEVPYLPSQRPQKFDQFPRPSD
tara:strand:- start:7819 stop:8925 length:1107 start_codon:yes stop_codon:yes gene_type:complete